MFLTLFPHPRDSRQNDNKYPNPLDKVLYLGIYCHFDGYPGGVGKELKTKFNTYEKVLNLILLGSCSSIITDIRAYHNWRNEDLEIVCKQGISPKIENGIDYGYIFENGEWIVLTK